MNRLLLALLTLSLTSAVFAQNISQETKAEILEEIGKLVKERAYVGGADFSRWDELQQKHRKEFDEADTHDEFANAVNRAFMEFGFSHLRLLTPRSMQIQRTGKAVGIGISGQIEPGGMRVIRVVPEGPAEKAGIKPGDLIVKADGKPVRGPEQIRGEKDTKVLLEIKRGDSIIEVTVKRSEFSTVTKDELKWIDTKTVMIRVNTFMTGYDRELIDKFFEEASKAERLILDLRSNGGGSTINLYHLAGKVFPPDTSLGKFITRMDAKRYLEKHPGEKDTPENVAKEFGMEIRARGDEEKVYKGQLVVLTDGGTGSASEILASAIQDHKRGKIVGATTAGAVLASTFFRLPEGFSLQLPLMEYVSFGGKRLEGKGVEPDYLLDAKDLANEELVLKAVEKVFIQMN